MTSRRAVSACSPTMARPASATGCTKHLNAPEGLTFGPDGRLYVATLRTGTADVDRIVILSADTGQCVDEIALDQAGGPRARAHAMVFGPGGSLFVPSMPPIRRVRRPGCRRGAEVRRDQQELHQLRQPRQATRHSLVSDLRGTRAHAPWRTRIEGCPLTGCCMQRSLSHEHAINMRSVRIREPSTRVRNAMPVARWPMVHPKLSSGARRAVRLPPSLPDRRPTVAVHVA
jgi:hypothetical protein